MRCPTCIHPEGYDRLSGPCPTCGGDGLPADPWQARHVESGAVVPCQDRAEAQAHVRESVSGRWVAERSFCPACSRPNHACGVGGPGSGEIECQHEWLDRPESDTRECLVCGTERV